MAAVKELLRAEGDGTLSFGDYTLASKTKKDNCEFAGDIYKVKTFSEITKLEKMVCLYMSLFREVRWKILKRPIQK